MQSTLIRPNLLPSNGKSQNPMMLSKMMTTTMMNGRTMTTLMMPMPSASLLPNELEPVW